MPVHLCPLLSHLRDPTNVHPKTAVRVLGPGVGRATPSKEQDLSLERARRAASGLSTGKTVAGEPVPKASDTRGHTPRAERG